MRSDSKQTGHQKEPMPVAAGSLASNTRLSPVRLFFSAVFSENEGLAFVNTLPGWKDAHALRKLEKPMQDTVPEQTTRPQQMKAGPEGQPATLLNHERPEGYWL